MSEKQAERREQIEAAAFEVLASVGYKKASMLQIAKKAKASNETLYAWYGNKQALFSSLIETNARFVTDRLEKAISGQGALDNALADIGTVLLQFTATENAIIVNRAAVADVQESGLLARAVDENARQVMYRLLETLMTKLEASDRYRFEEGPSAATSVFIDLLIGELQMQQALGSVCALSKGGIAKRADRAQRLFDRLYAIQPPYT